MGPEALQLAVVVVGQLLTAGAIWGALRADMRNLVREVADVRAATVRAHERIDTVLLKH